MYSKCMTTNDLFLRSCRRNPHKIALIDGSYRYSYSELDAVSNRLANALLARNLGRGDRVAVLSKNNKEMVISYFSLPKFRAVFVPLNYRCVVDELEYMLNDCEANYLIYDSEYSQAAAALQSRVKSLTGFMSIGRSDFPLAEDFEAVVSTAPSDPPGLEALEDDDCSILYTSGTTGRPKGAVITHRTRVWCTANMFTDGSVEAEGVTLPGGPLFHTGPTNISLLPHIAAGATVVVLSQLDPITLARTIQKEKVTHLASVPTVLHNLLISEAINQYDLSSLRKIYYGGSKMPLKDLNQILSILPKVEFYQGYGQTESTQLTVLRPTEQLPKFGCTGRAYSMVDLRVVNENDEDVAPNEPGEVVTKGPHVMREYLNLPEANREAFKNGWFHTGDIARMDEDGFITIVDRKKDMIISGGENIYPREIELILNAHPKIKESVVFGLPDDQWGESVCAGITLVGQETLTEEEITAYVREHLASYKKPKKIVFCDEFPRNTIGKVLKDKIKESVIKSPSLNDIYEKNFRNHKKLRSEKNEI